MRIPRVWLGLVVGGWIGGACSNVDMHRPFFHDAASESPTLSRARLGESFDEASATEFLSAEERAALVRSGYSADDSILLAEHPEDELLTDREAEAAAKPQGPVKRMLDKTAKVSIVVLSVGMTLGAMAAPYLLF
jgi:hypothetical protein